MYYADRKKNFDINLGSACVLGKARQMNYMLGSFLLKDARKWPQFIVFTANKY